MVDPIFLEREAIAALRGRRGFKAAAKGLWCAGSIEGLRRPCVAIVGTRAATVYGRGQARRFASELGAAGCCIISGLALGVDAVAHEGALEAGAPTIGVLGGGHRRFFPRRNIALAERIVSGGGAVLSPFPPEHDARPGQFLQRNGIVVALADALLVIEAPARSGALNTASWAAGNVPVLAVPGDVDRPHAQGCLALLRDGATLARGPADVLEAMGLTGVQPALPLADVVRKPVDFNGAAVLRALDKGAMNFDRLVAESGIAVPDAIAALAILELRGMVESRGSSSTRGSGLHRAAKSRGVSPAQTALRDFHNAARRAIERRFGVPDAAVGFEAPRRAEFGDYATNAAFALAKQAKRSPNEIATQIAQDVQSDEPQTAATFDRIEAVAGFINLRIAADVWQRELAYVLHEGASFGAAPSNGIRVSLEFGSANPTGPLVVVQGRSMSIGATLANAMRLRGYQVFTEWIINDAGAQLETLARSVYARYREGFGLPAEIPEDGYPGAYVAEIAKEIAERDGDRWLAIQTEEWVPYFGTFARDRLVAQQQQTAQRFGVAYDRWQSERELHETGKVREGIEHLRELGLTYEDDGALFFRATQFNDDKDRVLLRRDGRPTYFCMDVAYHYQKLRANDRVVDILGPDHHGYIERLQGLAAALGFPGRLEVLIAQQITLLRGNQQVTMSKRSGDIVTLDEILDEVGVDAARFFFIMPAVESPLSFDLKLATEKANDNPVYYVQYGHARIASVLRRADAADVAAAGEALLTVLTEPSEIALIRRVAEFPAVVADVVDRLAPHRLARYARDVASDFHQFYTDCKILDERRDLRLARLALSVAAKTVLAKTLALAGVSAPDSM